MASIFVYVIIGLMSLGVGVTVSKVGQERKPITGPDAAATVFLIGAEIAALVYVLGKI